MNLGTVSENSTIIALSGMLDVGEANFTNLAPGQNVTKTIHWKTSGFAAGTYTVGGQVLPVKGQTNTQNSIVRQATPVTLTEANTSVLQSPYLTPAIIAVLVALIAIIGFMFLQSRRKPPAQ
jgi:NADH:ubiquinone oxidoreductase subunit 6 (subunit J)